MIVVITFSPQTGFADVLLAAAAKSDKPLLVVWTAPESLTPGPLQRFRAAAFPVFDSPARAVAGLHALARFAGLQ